MYDKNNITDNAPEKIGFVRLSNLVKIQNKRTAMINPSAVFTLSTYLPSTQLHDFRFDK